jgi:DNA mismatch repair protein MutS2
MTYVRFTVINSIPGFLESDVDIVAAKAKYANRIRIVLPQITDNRRLYFRDAYHPCLYLNTNRKGNYASANHWTATGKQNCVISGPRYRWVKQISLKQLDCSNWCLIRMLVGSWTLRNLLFDRRNTQILETTNLVENHLSTYSYRLKNMNYFLKGATRKPCS